jgi:hypothetical protein
MTLLSASKGQIGPYLQLNEDIIRAEGIRQSGTLTKGHCTLNFMMLPQLHIVRLDFGRKICWKKMLRCS